MIFVGHHTFYEELLFCLHFLTAGHMSSIFFICVCVKWYMDGFSNRIVCQYQMILFPSPIVRKGMWEGIYVFVNLF